MLNINSTDTNLKFIGKGANNSVYRYFISNNDGEYKSKSIIVKDCNGHDARIDKNLNGYNFISTDLCTCAFLDICCLDGKRALVTEDLSNGDYIYVSPNSYFLGESDKRLIEAGFRKRDGFKISMAEQNLSDNPIISIKNLECLLDQITDSLLRVSKNRIHLYFDCYFWGVEKDKKDVSLSYIIADWDCITYISPEDEEPDGGFFVTNLYELRSSICQFICAFVVRQNQSTYIDSAMAYFKKKYNLK